MESSPRQTAPWIASQRASRCIPKTLGTPTAGGIGTNPFAVTAPGVATQPTSRTVFAGSSVTFQVEANGTPPLSYHWQKNQTDIPGGSQATLTLNGVQVTDEGSYRVTVSNALGSATSLEAILRVIGANTAPTLGAIGDQVVEEGSQWDVTLDATDADIPANVLTCTLAPGAPSGMTIDPAKGVIKWTPTEVQGPGVYPVTVRVTDNGSPPLSDSKTFNVTVNEVNNAPILTAVPNQVVEEGRELTVTATATDADIPANVLAYTLAPGAPSGVTIDSATGMVKWTPSLAQGPGPFPITVRVTDNGAPQLSDATTFNVTVTPKPNTPPVLAPIADQTLNELAMLSIELSATDADLPANALTYFVVSAPTGLIADPSTGRLTWTPTEAQGLSTNAVTVRVTDSGTPPLSDTKTFAVTVNEVNEAPVLAAIPDKNAEVGSPLTFAAIATDADFPANTLTFTLELGAPAGATIDPVSSVFTWTPTLAQESTTNQIAVRVEDNGSPPLADVKSFTIIVSMQPRGPVQLSASLLSNGSVKLVWNTNPGRTYTMQRSTDLVAWEDLTTTNAIDVSVEYVDAEVPTAQARFYRVVQR